MRHLVPLIVSALFVATAFSSCAQENQAAGGSRTEDAVLPGTLKRTQAAKVRVLPALRQEMQRALETTTVVESERQVVLRPQTTGMLTELLAEEGDKVETGQVLARLDQRDAQAALEDSRIALQEARDNEAKGAVARRDAEAQIKKAQLAAKQAKRDYERNEEARMISAIEIERLKLAMDIADQDVTAAILAKDKSEIEGRAAGTAITRAELAVERAEITLSYTEIRAPFSGVLTDRMVQVGDNVNTTTEAFNLTDLDDLRTRFYRPQREFGLFTGIGVTLDEDGEGVHTYEDIEVTATSEALPGHVFTGVIERISPNIDSASGSFRLTVRLEEESGGVRLLPGMLLRMRLVTERHAGALAVSKRALRREGDTTILFVAENGIARRVEVEEGFSQEDLVEVFPQRNSVLEAGMQVIVVGNRDLEQGSEVEIRPWDDEVVPVDEGPNEPDATEAVADRGDTSAQ